MQSMILVCPPPIDEATRRRAAELFPLLLRSKKLGRNKLYEKQREFELLYAGVSEAVRLGGTLHITTGNRPDVNHRYRRAVLSAASDAGVVEELPRAGSTVRRRIVPGRKWAAK